MQLRERASEGMEWKFQAEGKRSGKARHPKGLNLYTGIPMRHGQSALGLRAQIYAPDDTVKTGNGNEL